MLVLTLISFGVYGQSLTEKEITGTWQVVAIKNSEGFSNVLFEKGAYLDFYEDGSFILRGKKGNTGKADKIGRWSYDAASNSLEIPEKNLTFNVSGNADNAVFTIEETGVKLEVTKPI